ncbi:hypothetical protein BDV24DRAFT_157187 [Aspergillus arachidicola]|uniref:Fungal-type protein kinase domain-containing protein n=1 Tax=Aspergillus arachidicola TaxID=656916 RepID=A0A5N6YQB6_9EURO|nr:hypothetical protein BDV24DRAFT_157187 [Aspergillus arachidicola]
MPLRQAIAVGPDKLLKKALPDLKQGPGGTKSSALHRKKYFNGPLEPWPNFERDARLHVDAAVQAPNMQTISWTSRVKDTPATMNIEHFAVGDEGGVQGRTQQNVGQVLSAVCAAVGVDMSFADFKATIGTRIEGKVPDMVCMTNAGGLRIVGEIKVPWIKSHDIATTLWVGYPRNVSRLFGQIALYMKLANMRYGFLTTYEQTVFFRQVVSNGRWVLQYSDVIKGGTVRKEALNGNYQDRVTVRECFMYLMLLANVHHTAVNPLPMAQWVDQTPV